MKKRDHLVIRTEAEAQRDHAETWMWGFFCGVAGSVAMAVIWKWLL